MIVRLWYLVDKRALLVTAVCIVVWRVLEQIPLTDLSRTFLTQRLEVYDRPGFFAAIGSNSIPFSAYSVGSEGIAPYVNALIIISLLGVISSRVRGMFRTPEERIRLTRWTRALAVLLAMGQAYGFTVLDQSVGALPPLDWSGRLFACSELTAGTAVMMLLAGAMDEFGLGFGYGAFMFYALQIIGGAVHRFGDVVATNPSFEAAIKALILGSAWSVATCAACVAIVLGCRRVSETEIPILVSGVFRPSQFAFSILFLPTIAANYYVSSNASGAQWFLANWAPLGPTPWVDIAYIGLESSFVVLFAVFVAAYDRQVVRPDADVWAIALRLSVIAGTLIALLVVVAPIAMQLIERRVTMIVPISGFNLLVVVLLLLVAVRAIERRPLRLTSLFP